MPQFQIFFENRKSVGGYRCAVSGDEITILPLLHDAAYETVKFDDRKLQTALRRLLNISEMHQQGTMPLQTNEAVIKFIEDFGPLASHSDKKSVAHGLEPFHIFMQALSRALNRPISDEYKIRIIEVTIGKNKIVPHLAPSNLFEALLLTAKFPSENTWVICEYFQKYGRGRLRRKGECPPNCMVQTDGRRAWGDGCSEADRKERRKAERNYET